MSNRLLFQYIFINLLIATPRSSQCLWKCPVSSTCSWSHHSFTHLFDKLLLCTYYVPASVSVAQDIEVHWREKTSPCLHRAYVLVAERDGLYLAHSRIVSPANFFELEMNLTYPCCRDGAHNPCCLHGCKLGWNGSTLVGSVMVWCAGAAWVEFSHLVSIFEEITLWFGFETKHYCAGPKDPGVGYKFGQ